MALYSSRAYLFIVGERIVLSAQVLADFSVSVRIHSTNPVGSREAYGFFFIGMDGPVVLCKAKFLLTSEGFNVT